MWASVWLILILPLPCSFYFHFSDHVWLERGVQLVQEVLRDIFQGELLVNLPWALKTEEMQFGDFFFLSCHTYSNLAGPKCLFTAVGAERLTGHARIYYIWAKVLYLLELVSLFLLTWQNNRTDQYEVSRDVICNRECKPSKKSLSLWMNWASPQNTDAKKRLPLPRKISEQEKWSWRWLGFICVDGLSWG